MIEMQHVTYRFSDSAMPIFADFSCSFATRSVTAILGNSGVGKSTLLNLLAGLIVPESGSVTICHNPGYVFQEPRLLPWIPVIDNVMLPLLPYMSRSNAHKIASVYLKKTEIFDRQMQKPGQLSGGERQRVSLARAFAWMIGANQTGNRLLLLDEPFQALDLKRKQSIMENIRTLIKESENPLTTVLVTHDTREAFFLADRIIVIGGSPVSVIYDTPVTSKNLFGEFYREESAIITILASQ